MKICVYEMYGAEQPYFEAWQQRGVADIQLHGEVPSLATAHLAKGCEGVTTLGAGHIDAPLLDEWKRLGVKYLSTRTIGTNHIDLAHAAKIGIAVSSADYPPYSVAEFTIMLMLMCLRNYKPALWRAQVNDFSLGGLEGRDLRNMTVGVVGTGRIGRAVIEDLQGFGCKILAYNRHVRQDLADKVNFVSLDELFAKSDIISLHVPLTEATHHLINDEAIAEMKRGVVLINCSRGGLADTSALIRGIESGSIGALGMDVIEGEESIMHIDHGLDILRNQQMAYLRQFPNVVMTPHMAFFTDTDVASMVSCGIESILQAGR